MRHANSDFKIIVTERRKERKRWADQRGSPNPWG